MQEAVRWQIQHLGSNWKEGEVVMSNHPMAGGSHLPDITVITPVALMIAEIPKALTATAFY